MFLTEAPLEAVSYTHLDVYKRQSVTPEIYFCVSTFIPFLDTFMSQLDSRFLKTQGNFERFSVPFTYNPDPVLLPSQVAAFTSLTEFYASDIRSVCQEDLNRVLS